MSTSSRREKLLALLADEPNDPFLRYAIALEDAKEGSGVAAVSGLTALVADHPAYIPSYFQLGQLLAQQGELEPARQWLRQGIEVARSAGDAHAASEMAQLLTSLGSLGTGLS